MFRSTAFAAAAFLALTACSSSSASGPTPSNSPVATSGGAGVIVSIVHGTLVAPDGHTLYANTADSPAHPVCTGQCLKIWPPLYGTPKAGPGVAPAALGTVMRDTKTQITFRGHPLYEFSSDTGPGSMKGNGVTDAGGTWHPLSSSAGVAGTAPASSTGHRPAVPKQSGGSGYGGYP